MSTCGKVTLGDTQSEKPSWETGVEPHSQATDKMWRRQSARCRQIVWHRVKRLFKIIKRKNEEAVSMERTGEPKAKPGLSNAVVCAADIPQINERGRHPSQVKRCN